MYPENWRYTDVIGKQPIVAAWQTKPLTLEQTTGPGIGLMLGPLSGGVMSSDFDSLEAFYWFTDNIMDPEDLPPSPTWTSGKPGRFQMAFNVPISYWNQLRTRRMGPENSLEFRWTGGQSVLPPSPHPDGGCYQWLISPDEAPVADIPEKLLNYWYESCKPRKVTPFTGPVPVANGHLAETLEILQKHMPRPSFGAWRDIAWALATEIGVPSAKQMMTLLWPEINKGEYDQLYRGIDMTLSPTAGTLVFMVRQFKPHFLVKDTDADKRLKRKIHTLRRSRAI